MKRNFTLLLGLGLSVLAGCSKEYAGNNDNGALVPIELGAGVNVISRAVICSGSEVKAGIAGWEAASAPTYAEAPSWGGSDDPEVITTTASETARNVAWTAQRYYAPGGETTYMKAWSPAGTFSTGNTVSFANTNGSEDVLLAPVVSGSKTSKVSTPLAFRHMTSQIKFSVKKGEGLAEGTKIESITIKNAQLPTGFDLAKGIDDDGAVTYAAAADLTVPKIDSSQEISNTIAGYPVGDAVMIKPIASKTFTVDITTNNASYANKTVTVTTDQVLAGYAYEITLTFGQAGIELTATVADWKTASGSAEIQ
jgi:hypothetical protein